MNTYRRGIVIHLFITIVRQLCEAIKWRRSMECLCACCECKYVWVLMFAHRVQAIFDENLYVAYILCILKCFVGVTENSAAKWNANKRTPNKTEKKSSVEKFSLNKQGSSSNEIKTIPHVALPIDMNGRINCNSTKCCFGRFGALQRIIMRILPIYDFISHASRSMSATRSIVLLLVLLLFLYSHSELNFRASKFHLRPLFSEKSFISISAWMYRHSPCTIFWHAFSFLFPWLPKRPKIKYLDEGWPQLIWFYCVSSDGSLVLSHTM